MASLNTRTGARTPGQKQGQRSYNDMSTIVKSTFYSKIIHEEKDELHVHARRVIKNRIKNHNNNTVHVHIHVILAKYMCIIHVKIYMSRGPLVIIYTVHGELPRIKCLVHGDSPASGHLN
jgi:hypothetical protein